jgi:3,4-dihydroxy 2-butanone 4-phosphate synthase/GTP cyclohydrolase II
MDCDCGYQLQQAMALIERAGAGVLIYLDQEGRGSGLANKARGYRLTQTRGVDTFQAYRELDLPEDQRDYAVAVKALQGLGLTAIRLLTNNPQKVLEVARAGIQVERVPLVPPEWAESRDYIQAKRARGHLV